MSGMTEMRADLRPKRGAGGLPLRRRNDRERLCVRSPECRRTLDEGGRDRRFSVEDACWRGRLLLGMAASRRLAADQDPVSRHDRSRPPVPMGDCSVLTPRHRHTPRRRRGAAPAPRFAMAKAWPDGSASSNTRRGGRGIAPRRRGAFECPSVKSLQSPIGKARRARRSREHAVHTGPRRPPASMPSQRPHRVTGMRPESPQRCSEVRR